VISISSTDIIHVGSEYQNEVNSAWTSLYFDSNHLWFENHRTDSFQYESASIFFCLLYQAT